MNTIKATFRPATIRTLEICYDCNLTRAGDVIPLGVLVDLSVEGVYGLSLVARKTLSATEADKIGALVRADFAAPFTYLQNVFNLVLKADRPPSAFERLVDEHTHSLRFEPRAVAAFARRR